VIIDRHTPTLLTTVENVVKEDIVKLTVLKAVLEVVKTEVVPVGVFTLGGKHTVS
jgi:hypothetical protein